MANNLAHDSSHIVEAESDGEAFSQDECGSCHVFKGTMVADSRTPLSAFAVGERVKLYHAPAALNPRFPLYLSRAPPQVRS